MQEVQQVCYISCDAPERPLYAASWRNRWWESYRVHVRFIVDSLVARLSLLCARARARRATRAQRFCWWEANCCGTPPTKPFLPFQFLHLSVCLSFNLMNKVLGLLKPWITLVLAPYFELLLSSKCQAFLLMLCCKFPRLYFNCRSLGELVLMMARESCFIILKIFYIDPSSYVPASGQICLCQPVQTSAALFTQFWSWYLEHIFSFSSIPLPNKPTLTSMFLSLSGQFTLPSVAMVLIFPRRNNKRPHLSFRG